MRHKAFKNIITCLIIIIFVILSWQFLLSQFSILSNIFLLILFFLMYNNGRNEQKKEMIISILIVSFLAGYSLIMQNEVSLIVRFALIIMFVLFAYMVNVNCINSRMLLKGVFIISLVLCVSVVFFEFLLLFYLGESEKQMIRNEALNTDMGDIYPSGFLYKIQLRGLPIIPFLYMYSYVSDLFPVKYKQFFRFIFLLTIVFAGNFAYLLGLLVFHALLYFYGMRKRRLFYKRVVLAFFIIVSLGFPFISYVTEVYESKKEMSNAIRVEQTNLLLEDLGSDVISLIMGRGLGNTIDVSTHFRDYTGNVYFELQLVYILNQLGVIPFFLLIMANVYFVCRYMTDNKIKIAYLGYVTYAVTNPYIMDTTQIIVIILLLVAQNKKNIVYNEKGYLCISSIQS